jgi:alpha/beta superfamily hydrolase
VRLEISSDGLVLQGHLAGNSAEPTGRVLVVCHGFPSGPRGAASSGHTYPQLADRLAAEAGWRVLSFNFRGTGESGGEFSLGGWIEDLRCVVAYASALPNSSGVWLAGFSTGGSLAICVAGEDEAVKGVATFAAPADFAPWASDADAFLERARGLGLISRAGFPPDREAWVRELHEIRPLDMVAKIPPRPILIVHGGDDEVVPSVDARALADATHGQADLRLLTGAGHRLRHDPRAVALLLGWMERQGA